MNLCQNNTKEWQAKSGEKMHFVTLSGNNFGRTQHLVSEKASFPSYSLILFSEIPNIIIYLLLLHAQSDTRQ
jgi:hypothetical protein